MKNEIFESIRNLFVDRVVQIRTYSIVNYRFKKMCMSPPLSRSRGRSGHKVSARSLSKGPRVLSRCFQCGNLPSFPLHFAACAVAKAMAGQERKAALNLAFGYPRATIACGEPVDPSAAVPQTRPDKSGLKPCDKLRAGSA